MARQPKATVHGWLIASTALVIAGLPFTPSDVLASECLLDTNGNGRADA